MRLRLCRQAGARMFRLKVSVERWGESLTGEDRDSVIQPAPVLEPAHAVPISGLTGPAQASGSSPCPSCGSREMHRSKGRTLYERLKKAHSVSRVFRCHHCGWRGWLLPLECAMMAEASGSPNLTAIDTFLGADIAARRDLTAGSFIEQGPGHRPGCACFLTCC